MLKIFKVEGHSLYPYLKQGQRIVCFRVFIFNKIRPGDFIIFRKEPYGLMIKRVKYIQNKQVFAQGTDPSSIDSRDFGLINATEIRYKMISIKFLNKLIS